MGAASSFLLRIDRTVDAQFCWYVPCSWFRSLELSLEERQMLQLGSYIRTVIFTEVRTSSGQEKIKATVFGKIYHCGLNWQNHLKNNLQIPCKEETLQLSLHEIITFSIWANETVSCCASDTARVRSTSVSWRTDSSIYSSLLSSAVSLESRDPGDKRSPPSWEGMNTDGGGWTGAV